jgi:hypothetical protein
LRRDEVNKVYDGGPAFPRDNRNLGHDGMALRDWFAGQAAASIVGGLAARTNLVETKDLEAASKAAYWIADMLLVERSK